MQDFEWVSESPLRQELVMKVVASFGILFAIACILLVLGYALYSVLMFLLAIVASVFVFRKTGPTKIAVKGNDLYYGSSITTCLERLREVRVIRQLGIEEVIVLEGSKPHILIPTKGIPENVCTELISILRERIDISAAEK